MFSPRHSRSSSGFSSTSTLPTLYEHDFNFVKEEDLWFEDGDMVIVAHDSQSDTSQPLRAFKVHQHVLERQSTVWIGVFVGDTITPSKAAPPSYDDVPLVELPDTAEDIYHYLQWTYVLGYLGHFSLASWLDDGIEDRVESLLRMADAYDVLALRRDVVDFLEREWPARLESWDAQEAAVVDKIREDVIEEYCAGPDALRAIELARAHELPQLLPAALYHLNRVFFDPGPDGAMSLTPQTVVHFPVALQAEVPAADLRRLLRARAYCQTSVAAWAHAWPDVRAGHHVCRAAAEDWWAPYRARLLCGVEALDPLGVLREAACSARDGMCNDCRFCVGEALQRRRRAIWECLPAWFDVAQAKTVDY